MTIVIAGVDRAAFLYTGAPKWSRITGGFVGYYT